MSVADWKLKREWHQYANEQFAAAGYRRSSAYTMVKDRGQSQQFVYRDAVWQGSDMLGTGVASFSHLSGIHFQNAPSWGDYLAHLEANRLPVSRALMPTDEERLTREMILQLKLGEIRPSYFEEKFGADILTRFAGAYEKLRDDGMLTFASGTDEIRLTQRGLLQVDALLPTFYAPEYQHTRYT